MRAGGALLAVLLLLLTAALHQTSSAEDIYWEGEEEASNEFLEVKEESLGVAGHLRRLKRGFFDFWADTSSSSSTTTTESYDSTTDTNFDLEAPGREDDTDADLGSGSPDREADRGDADSEPREKTLRVTFVVIQPYEDQYNKRDSQQFKQFSTSLANAVNQLFDQLPGTQRASLVRIQSRISDEFSCKVTLDIVTTGYEDTDRIANILHDHILKKRALGSVVVSDADFSANVIDPGSSIDVCAADELTCDNGQCVAISTRCNGYAECSDGSDEVGCPIDLGREGFDEQQSFDQVTQPDSGVGFPTETPESRLPEPEPTSWLPWGSNGDDKNRGDNNGLGENENVDETTPAPEETTPYYHSTACRNDELRCDETRCLPLWARCDGHADCYDGADEANCNEETCGADDFRCDNGKCIEGSRRCDRVANCPTGEDEMNCKCRPDEFTCVSDRSCIEGRKVCDGHPNCADKSDEADCACSSDQWQCDHGSCIKRSQRCDGRVDCPTDRSDERNCYANGYFRCRNGALISKSLRCNRRYDCPNGDYSDEQNCPCDPSDFRCDNGYCIPAYKHCDRTHDCQDRSDERHCTYGTVCMAYEFMCSSGECVQSAAHCNGTEECVDGSDERNCPCRRDEFSCQDGTCISLAQRCDGLRHCLKGEDEWNCRPTRCPADSFMCDPSSSIKCAKRCDGRSECDNGEDEDNCEECNQECDGRCLEDSLICNGVADCSDGSDEDHCDGCDGPRDFRCRSGECLNIVQRCNGVPECSDYSDEDGCQDTVTPSPSGCLDNIQFQCRIGTCIDSQFVCDGNYDCIDKSDEENCPCRPNEFQCVSGQCIPASGYCDGTPQCTDETDEQSCPTTRPPWFTTTYRPPYRPPPPTTYRPTTRQPYYPTSSPFPPSEICNRNQWRCENGPCIETTQRCDGHVDCPLDSSDEFDCPAGSPIALNLRAYPEDQTVRNGGDVVFQCRDEGPQRAPVRWVREGGRPLKPGSTDRNGRLEMIKVSPSDSGVYICQATRYLGYPGSELRVTLAVDTAPPISSGPVQQACQSYQATCGNGQCIPKSAVCDGNRDCSDGSDEDNCNLNGLCEPNQFQCENRKCVLKTWLCDFEDDCGDNSDEANCGPRVAPPGQCLGIEFKCHDGDQCVPKSFHCDGESDCLDHSDELGCAPVHVTKPPTPSNIRLSTGDTLTLTCEAVGVPTPLISWRLNWGHVPPNCTSTSRNGIGVLTCHNMQPEHSGAYSCEAMNNKGTIFAVPDSIVYVNRTDVCPVGYFNSEAKSESDCIRCFCFGESTSCRSADLFTFNMPTPLGEGGTRLVGVIQSYAGDFQVDKQPITDQYFYKPLRNGATVTKLVNYGNSWTYGSNNAHPYLTLPETYNGNQLTSYGGYIRYRLTPHSPRYGQQNDRFPDIIIKGKYGNLIHQHRGDKSRETYIEARLTPENWQKFGQGGVRPATREDIMMALDNVEIILLRADMDNAGSNITSFAMESAQQFDVGLGAANLVEQCACPPGYEGLSCQKCASGYTRERSGPWLGNCVPELPTCPPGSYGDPASGYACRPCPCPLTNPENQFARTCSVGPNGAVRCDCRPGYDGEHCEYCAQGYEGNPLIPGDSCRPKPSSRCDPVGTQTPLPMGECQCKSNVQGRYCDQCKDNSYFLSPDFRQGCAQCFCLGVSSTCRSSNLRRKTTSVLFNTPAMESQVRVFSSAPVSSSGNVKYNAPMLTDLQPQLLQNGVLGLASMDQADPSREYYWSFPISFTGDKVTAYGGYLSYQLTNVPTGGRNNAPDVLLISENRLNFHYFGNFQPSSDGTLNATVQFLETGWQRPDGKEIPREHFLLALADVKALMVKASYSNYPQLASLASASIETAEAGGTGPPALHVEQCVCPAGYVGSSCEDCAPGYTRTGDGIYLKHCGPCNCNNHSSSCHPETGVCYDCRDNTAGDHCEYCRPGFEKNPYGDCIQTIDTYTTPRQCSCDPRGEASCRDGVCVCKQNVEGDFCDYCRSGTFGLDRNDPLGCMPCYCSGATSDCHEAGHYSRVELGAPIFGENYGGYTLTNMNADRVINDQFNPDPNESELTYSFSFPPDEELYWSLPIFPGNRLLSYGGMLRLTQKFDAGGYPDVSSPGTDVVLVGDKSSVYWSNPTPIRSGEALSYQVPLRENSWFIQSTATPANRNDFMAVLKNLKRVLVRATLVTDILSTSIADVSMDYATESNDPTATVAKGIEVCMCPEGYSGTSCESCSPGWYRDPYNTCRQCNCNGHDCQLGAYNEVVCTCRPPYSGPDCSTIGEDSTVYTTTVRPPPEPRSTVSVRITTPSIKIQEVGSSVSFICEAQSRMTTGRLPVQWSKAGGELPQGRAIVDSRTGRLLITNLQITDSGKYICQTSDGISTGQAIATLNVPGNKMTIPVVDLRPVTQEYYEGERIVLECIATGNPSPRISWQRAGRYPLPQSYQATEGTLVIESAREEDSGEYRCTATNAVGSTDRVSLVTVRPRPWPSHDKLTVSPNEPTVNEGQRTRIVCTGTPNIPAGSIDWVRQDQQEFSTNVRSENGVLYIDYARIDDQGVYTCQSSSPNVNPVSVVLTVVPTGPPPPSDKPSITVSRDRVVIPTGGSGSVDCIPQGYPTPLVRWTKHNGEFGPGTSQRENTLIVNNAQDSDGGYYLCEGLVDGQPVNSIYISIDIERREPPRVEIWPQGEQAVALGSQHELRCQVMRGVPEPAVTWDRAGGRPLSPHAQILKHNVLRFESIDVNDEGEYTCTATNVAGSSSASAVLKVRSPPEIIITPRNLVEAIYGDPVTVECRANGYPEPMVSIKTSQDMREVVPSSPRIAVLRIGAISERDEGDYVCTATSPAGTIDEQFAIRLNRRGDGGFGDGGGSGEGEFYPPDREDQNNVPTAMIAYEGQDRRIECDAPEGFDVVWRRADGRPLQRNAVQSGTALVIRNASKTDSGQYECTIINVYTNEVQQAAHTILNVVAAPKITLRPKTQTVHPGQSPTVECIVDGDEIIDISWRSRNGASLSGRVETRGSRLIFHQIEVEDAGQYECIARNRYANATAVAEVIVSEYSDGGSESHENEQWAHVGAAVHLSCNVSAPRVRIRWTKDGRRVPSARTLADGSLHIRLAQKSDTGLYKCIIQDEYGRQTSNYINLHIQGECAETQFRCYDDSGCIEEELLCDGYYDCRDNSDEDNCLLRDKRLSDTGIHYNYYYSGPPEESPALVTIDQPRRSFRVGENVEVLCRTSSKGTRANWEKYANQQRQYAETRNYGDGSMLIVRGVQESDAGIYRCTGVDPYGRSSYEDFNLEVIPVNIGPSRPLGNQDRVYTATLGRSVDMPCIHDLEPPAAIEWRREFSPLPSEVRKDEPNIHLERVTESDAGTYVCRVSNSVVAMETRAVLRVEGVVPRFGGDSWISMPTIKDAYQQFDIEVSFNPYDANGLILYNSGNLNADRTGDYVALQLVDGVPQFSYDASTGPVTVRGDRPLQLNTWHTIRISRIKSKVTMDVDNTGPFVAKFPGQWDILELSQPLYIGGVPDYNELPDTLAGATGFIGCVSMLILGREEQNIVVDSLEQHNINDCDTCAPNLCQNNGVCQGARNERGYMCLCAAGFAGLNCDRTGEACRPGLCGPGKCSDTADGYKCACPVTYAGKNCESKQQIEYPAFTGSAYLAIKPPQASRYFQMSMKVKASSPVSDGLIVYCAESARGYGGFTSLAVHEGKLEFRYDLGDGSTPVVLISDRPLPSNEWTNVNIARVGAMVSLKINLVHTFEERLESPQKQLHLETPMFVGGVDDSIVLNNNTGVTGGFNGCIKDVAVYGASVDIVNASIASANIQECSNYDRGDIPEIESTCSQCRNGGYCASAEASYCTCPTGYTGQYCENRVPQPARRPEARDPCAARPCRNNGVCRPDRTSRINYTCDCPLGFAGANCQMPLQLLQSVGFNGNGYLELPSELLRYEKLDREAVVIALAFHTTSDGVILYQREGIADANYGDYILMRVDQGHLVLDWDLGSGQSSLVIDDVFVNDGLRHGVVAILNTDQTVWLSVDHDHSKTGFTTGLSNLMNADSNIYMGGIPDAYNVMRYPGLTGCIEQVELDGRNVNLGEVAVSGRNAQRCREPRSFTYY